MVYDGLLVKRLRRRPLTAESGVRFPLGLPNEKIVLLDEAIFFIKIDYVNVPRVKLHGNFCFALRNNRTPADFVANALARKQCAPRHHKFDSPWDYQMKKLRFGLSFATSVKTLRFDACFFIFAAKRKSHAATLSWRLCGDSLAKKMRRSGRR